MLIPLARMPFHVFICEVMPICSLSVFSSEYIISSPPAWRSCPLSGFSHVPLHQPRQVQLHDSYLSLLLGRELLEGQTGMFHLGGPSTLRGAAYGLGPLKTRVQ